MFGSDLLDIAIGMIFVYLLLSLICSAANEIIEGWLKNRATDLERGIRELLSPNTGVSNEGTVAKLYNHPLINGLHRGFYKDYVAYYNHNKLVRWFIRTFTTNPKLPSYIPARNFALALMDTILPATSAHTPAAQTNDTTNGNAADADAAGNAARAAAQEPAGALLEANAQAADRRSGATGATPPGTRAAAAAVARTEAAEGNALQPLRDAVGAIPNKQTRDALLTLVDAAVNDPAKARENIEAWFNSSMDRVSGWYKQRTQFIIFVLGFAIAIALNADSVTLVKSLSTDKTLRDSLVVAAEAYAKANPSPTPATTDTRAADAAPKPSPAVGAQPTPSVSPTATPLASPPAPAAGTTGTTNDNTATNGTKTGTTTADTTTAATTAPAQASPTPTVPPECVKDANSPECKLAKNREAIKSLGLPIGWLDAGDTRRVWPGNNWRGAGGWLDQIYWHFLGWLITALAVSLGAPFWFDLLNKFIVVRSTVKPHEKSREEGSKE